MNQDLIKFFSTGKLTDFGWVIFLIYGHDYIETSPTIAVICIVGAIALAGLNIFHKSYNQPSVKQSDTTSTPNT